MQENTIDFLKLEKLTFEMARGKLTPVEISEYNNLLGQITGELNTAVNAEEVEKFKKRFMVLHSKYTG